MILLKRFLLLSLFGLGCLLMAAAAGAQSATPPGVDLIIIIDQSGSMDGTDKVAATDPDKIRDDIAKYLIDYLAFDNNYVNPQRTNRVAVIGFGSPDKTHLLVNLTSLKNQSDLDTAEGKVVPESLGNTSFLSALQLVRQLFPRATDGEVDNGPRQRLIVLVSDGSPYDSRELTYAQYFDEIRQFYEKELGRERFPIYLVEIDKDRTYWPLVEPYWSSLLGKDNGIVVEQIEQVSREIVSRFCPFLNERGIQACRLQELGWHFVQPYARTLQLSFFKYQQGANLTLHRADNSVVPKTKSGDVADYREQGPNEMYVIKNPRAGCWYSERTGTGRVDVFTQVVFNSLRMSLPAGPQPQVVPLSFAFELNDQAGVPIDEDPQFPILFDAVLTGPQGSNFRTKITIQKTAPGRYASTQLVELPKEGAYVLTVNGTTTLSLAGLPAECRERVRDQLKVAASATQVSFPVFSNQFQIPVYKPGLRVTNASPHLQYEPVQGLSFEYLDQQGKALALPAGLPWTIDAKVLSPAGNQTALPKPVLQGGVYRVPTPVFLTDSGTYTITLGVQGQAGNLFENQVTLRAAENIQVIRPGQNHPAFAPAPLVEVRLLNLQSKPYAGNQEFPLRLEALLLPPEGKSEPVDLKADPNDPATYRTSVAWEFTQPGSYLVQVTGYAVRAPGEPDILAFRAQRTINVSSNLPFLRLVAPDPTRAVNEYPLHYWYLPSILPASLQPMPFRTQWIYGNQPASADDYFRTRDLRVSITGPNGIQVEKALEDMGQNHSLFGLDLPELKEEGVYTATVKFTGAVKSNVASAGAWPDQTANFVRRDSSLYATGWAALGVLGGLAVLGLVVMFSWNRIPPFPRGKLYAELENGTVLWEANLTPKQRRVIRFRRIPGSLKLKEIKVSRATQGVTNPQEGIKIEAQDAFKRQLSPKYLYSRGNKTPTVGKTDTNQNYRFHYESDEKKTR